MILFLNLVNLLRNVKMQQGRKAWDLRNLGSVGPCHHRSCNDGKNLAGGDRRRSWRKVMELVLLLIAGRVKQVHFLLALAGVFSEIKLNHPFSTSGLGRDLFHSTTPALFY